MGIYLAVATGGKFMNYIFYISSGLLIFMSYRSFRGGIDYLNYFRREMTKPIGSYVPFATVIVPCKGLDEGLEDNLEALMDQDYSAYEVVFVVDSESDPAVSVIKEISRKDAKKTGFVIAPRSTGSSQKVENLREAVLHAADGSEVFVFADSDVRPSRDWLTHLVAPLDDEKIGAATGYRWFISGNPSFASEMRSVWNASIASALGPNRKSNFCWGGSTAIRRDIFEQIGMREKWSGTLADDFTVTRAMKAAGLAIYFVPRALTASVGNCSLRELLEFTNRQMKITRVYAPHLWMLSFFGSGLFNTVMIAAILIAIIHDRNDLNVFSAITVIVLVSLFSFGKSWLRLKAADLVMGGQWPQIRKQRFTQNTLWILSPALFLLNCIAALFSRSVKWRGIRYKLKSPTETVIITD